MRYFQSSRSNACWLGAWYFVGIAYLLKIIMTLPNFFIVGAPKAGTDELYYDLAQHPEIYMSPLKEPCYFSSEIRIQNFEPALRSKMEQAVADTARYLE